MAARKSAPKLRYRQVPAVVVLALLLVIIAVFSAVNMRLNRNIASLQGMVDEGSYLVALKQKELSELSKQVQLASTDDYIANLARTQYGYLSPGEIRFVVTNPEALWGKEGAPADMPIKR